MDISTLTNSASSPTSISSSTGAFSQLTNDFDTFLTLLTTQLQNQDPLEPLDTEQFTSQLVQFAGVEQSIQTNSNLEALIGLQSNSDKQISLDFVGRVASIAGGEITLTGANDDSLAWRYTLPANADLLSLDVVDSAGRTVTTLNGPTNAGTHNLVWDGRLANGNRAPVGNYTLRANATLNDGTEISPALETRGRVDSILLSGDTPQLSVNGRLVNFDAITRVDARF